MQYHWLSTLETYQKENAILRKQIKEKDDEIKRLKDKYEMSPINKMKQTYYNILTSTNDAREFMEYNNRYVILGHIAYVFMNYPKLEEEFTDLTGTSQELRQRFDTFIISKRKEYPKLESYRSIREGSEYLGFE